MSNGPAPERYKIKVNTVFSAHNEMFYPSHDYWVPVAIYEGKLPDGRVFKDLCASAQPEYPVS